MDDKLILSFRIQGHKPVKWKQHYKVYEKIARYQVKNLQDRTSLNRKLLWKIS